MNEYVHMCVCMYLYMCMCACVYVEHMYVNECYFVLN